MSLFRAANNANTNSTGTVDALSRESYPVSRAREEAPAPDGPAGPIEDRAGRGRDRIARFAMVVAVLSLTISVAAALAAWRSLTMARSMPMVMAPITKPEISNFSVMYAQEALRVQVGCAAVLYVDLDEPRANAPEKISDLRYDSRCGQEPPRLVLGPGAAGAAQVKDADTDAAGCERAIRNSPLGPGASAVVRKGTVLCVLTAATPPSLALVEVTDVGRTGTAGMRATSWKVAR